jgi:hypothetical protein
MQLLDVSSINQIPDSILEIVTKIEIQPNFCITHPDYDAVEISPEFLDSLQKLPEDIQNKYLNLQLRNFLYDVYYSGSLKSRQITNSSFDIGESEDNIENNKCGGFNRDFFQALRASNSGKGFLESGWQIINIETDGLLAIAKDGLTLHIDPKEYLSEKYHSANIGDIISILMPANLLEQDFYVAVGNQGLVKPEKQPVNIYFNFTAEGAVVVMKNLTQQLNQEQIPFAFKVLSDPDNYDRDICGILQFSRCHYQLVKRSIQYIYIKNQSYFNQKIPFLTKHLAPGVSLAEEPQQKSTPQEDYGMHRCRMIAHGLLAAWEQGDNSAQKRINFIHQYFSQQGIELHLPYLNHQSEDIYKY